MSFPKWVDPIDYSQINPYVHKLTQALSIAWEALEELKNIRYELRSKDFIEDSDYPAKEAMRRIEEIGK
jgi:hypothetical protein